MSRAALYGTREPPSSPAKTEANAVMMIPTVKICAVPLPHAFSRTSEATELESLACCQGTTPSTPTWSRKYSPMIPRMA